MFDESVGTTLEELPLIYYVISDYPSIRNTGFFL
jgi:hypothetical protein